LNNCFEDVDAKVFAKWNVVYVHEDRILAITLGEAIPNATRHYIGIGTAVRDRDLWHCGLGKTVDADGTTREIGSESIFRHEIDSESVLPTIVSTRADEGVDHQVRPGDDENARNGSAPQAAATVETSAGRWARNGVAFSKASATRNRVGSWNGLPTSWIATGSLPAPNPAQTEIAG
jgi:hypothetical protein